MRAGTFGILVALLILLAGAGCYAYVGLIGRDALPPEGWIALVAGVVFSILVGCGLMALLFFSSRHGYDEPPRWRNDV